jgi:hydrogenase nickel incorporation protein HypA/HybF
MHELSLAMSILEIVETEIEQRAGGTPKGRVPSLTVRVGALSGVEPEALSFAWEVAREQGPFRDAALVIELVAAKAACDRCGAGFLLAEGSGECAVCGPVGFRVVEGHEVEVTRIVWEIDDPEGEGGA